MAMHYMLSLKLKLALGQVNIFTIFLAPDLVWIVFMLFVIIYVCSVDKDDSSSPEPEARGEEHDQNVGHFNHHHHAGVRGEIPNA